MILELEKIKLNIILDGNVAIAINDSQFINTWQTETSNPTKSYLDVSAPFYFTVDDNNFVSNVQFVNRSTSVDMGLYLRVLQFFFKNEKSK